MTRNEFLEDVCDWYDLINFCYDNSINLLDDVYDKDSMDAEINYELAESVTSYSWRDILEHLENIPHGHTHYLKGDCGWFDWTGLGDYDFDDYKSDVLYEMDCSRRWDEEEAEDSTEDSTEDSAEEDDTDVGEEAEEEDFSVDDLIGMCSVAYVTIQEDNMRRVTEDNNAFEEYIKND